MARPNGVFGKRRRNNGESGDLRMGGRQRHSIPTCVRPTNNTDGIVIPLMNQSDALTLGLLWVRIREHDAISQTQYDGVTSAHRTVASSTGQAFRRGKWPTSSQGPACGCVRGRHELTPADRLSKRMTPTAAILSWLATWENGIRDS